MGNRRPRSAVRWTIGVLLAAVAVAGASSGQVRERSLPSLERFYGYQGASVVITATSYTESLLLRIYSIASFPTSQSHVAPSLLVVSEMTHRTHSNSLRRS
ncbi:unnamed protein product [Phaeothamnion confervicola]